MLKAGASKGILVGIIGVRKSPYLTFHVNRFGKYRLDSNRRPPDIEFDIPVSPIPIEVAG